MREKTSDDVEMRYQAREVVGIFPTDAALEAAVEQLGIAGVDRAAISVLAAYALRGGVSALQLADDPSAPRGAFVSHVARVELLAAGMAAPALVGGFAAPWAVAANGGAMVTESVAGIAAAVIGAAAGWLVLRLVAQRYAARVATQVAHGGMALWVSTPDDDAERCALDVLRRCGGKHVHAHRLPLQWGVADVPLRDVQPDPFLEQERV